MGQFSMTMPEQSELAGGANFLKVPGMYHLHIKEIDESPVDRQQKAVDGFKVMFDVLGGPEAGKKMDVIFFHPKASEPGKKNWAHLKQAAFLLATGLVDKSKCGGDVTIELQDATDRQVVAEFQFDERDAEKPVNEKFLQLHFANIYHVDDPRGDKAVKDAKALSLLPKEMRRDPASFKDPAPSANGNGHAKSNSQPANVSDDLGDI